MNDKYITFYEVKKILGVKDAQGHNIIREYKAQKYHNSKGHVRFKKAEIERITKDREKFTAKEAK